MQENRSFDHYFGTLRGVRGFGDPRAIDAAERQARSGISPTETNSVHALPSRHADDQRAVSARASTTAGRAATTCGSTTMPGSRPRPLTMGYFTRDDIPFYHALADAFTICDAYHCSVFGPTNPNRLFLFTRHERPDRRQRRHDRLSTIRRRRPTRPPIPATMRRHFKRASTGRPMPSGCRPRASTGASIRNTTITATTRSPISSSSAASTCRPNKHARARARVEARTPPTRRPRAANIWLPPSRRMWPRTGCRKSPGSSRPTIMCEHPERAARPTANR